MGWIGLDGVEREVGVGFFWYIGKNPLGKKTVLKLCPWLGPTVYCSFCQTPIGSSLHGRASFSNTQSHTQSPTPANHLSTHRNVAGAE